MWLTYSVIAVILLIAELAYFRIADKCNIIDKPNERSSHSTIVLRGGGVIFSLSMIVWAILMVVQGNTIAQEYEELFRYNARRNAHSEKMKLMRDMLKL